MFLQWGFLQNYLLFMPATFLSVWWFLVISSHLSKSNRSRAGAVTKGQYHPKQVPTQPKADSANHHATRMAPADRSVEAFFPRMPPSIRSGSPWRALQPRAHHVSPLGVSTELISGLCVLFMGICAVSPPPSHQLWHLGTTTITAQGGASDKEPACRCRRCERCGFDP